MDYMIYLKDELQFKNELVVFFKQWQIGCSILRISILKNPFATVAAFKSVLVSFATGLKTVALTLKAHPLVAAALAHWCS